MRNRRKLHAFKNVYKHVVAVNEQVHASKIEMLQRSVGISIERLISELVFVLENI